MKRPLAWAAALEVAVGLSLVIVPSLLPRLLFGEGIVGAAAAMGRMAGLGLFSLGIACWPPRDERNGRAAAYRALIAYNVLVTLLLVVLGIGRRWVGLLLWPSVVLHIVLAVLLIAGWTRESRGSGESAPR
jgi:hypothetical protein